MHIIINIIERSNAVSNAINGDHGMYNSAKVNQTGCGAQIPNQNKAIKLNKMCTFFSAKSSFPK